MWLQSLPTVHIADRESKRMAPQVPLHIDTRDIFLQFLIIDVFSVGFRLIAVSKTDLKKQFY